MSVGIEKGDELETVLLGPLLGPKGWRKNNFLDLSVDLLLPARVDEPSDTRWLRDEQWLKGECRT